MSNAIPDRWLNYRSFGQIVQGTDFLPFKVPLSKVVCRQLRFRDRFTPELLLEEWPEITAVIDLTFTTRYYSPIQFTCQGITYQKIFCPGRVTPSETTLQKFFDAVDNISLNRGGLIGVHCTHGLNRTGYFISSYMIQRLGFPPEQAILSFEAARGYKIERRNYIESLLNMSWR